MSTARSTLTPHELWPNRLGEVDADAILKGRKAEREIAPVLSEDRK